MGAPDPAHTAEEVRQSIAACLLGEPLGFGNGVNVLRVADILIRDLPRMGWTFTRTHNDGSTDG
jgi:hypothetical protein